MHDRKLHLLDTFDVVGPDGQRYRARAYEHLVQDDSLAADGREHWEPTGESEVRLEDGRLLEWVAEREWRVSGGSLRLHQPSG
jgi:hypothetical protein